MIVRARTLCCVVFVFGSGSWGRSSAAEIRPVELQITAPAADEVWSAGSKHYVTWKADARVDWRTLKFEFTADDGENWNAMVTDRREAGKALWHVPKVVSDRCRIRILARQANSTVKDESRFSIVQSQQGRDYRWTHVTNDAAYAPRDGAGALVYGGKMWLLGGWNPGDKAHFPRICNNEVWSSTDGATWALAKPNTYLDAAFNTERDWEGRHTAGYAVYNDKMWIVGGDVNQGHYQFDVWNSTDGATWMHVNKGRDVPWGPRALHYTLVFQDKIWIMGGQTMPAFARSQEKFYRDVWNTADGVHWNRIMPEEPYWTARGMIGGSAVFNNRMWILGGGTYDTPATPTRNFFNDVWSSADGVHWHQHTASAPWEPRQYHDVAVFDGRMWVLEGYSNKSGNRNDVWYSADGVNWYELADTPWKPRHAASVFVHDGALWMVAGNNMEKDVWKLQRLSSR